LKEKLTAVLKFIRPINFLITFISVIAAALISRSAAISYFMVFLAAISASFTLAAGNIINDIYDLEIDRINRPQRPLPSGTVTIKEALIFYFAFLLISVLISVQINIQAVVIVLASHLLLFLYSKYLKRILFVGNFTVAFLTGLVFIFGGVIVENPSAAVIPAVFAFFINLIREIVKDMEDVEGDKQAGATTFPVKFGSRKSSILILFFTFPLFLFTFYPFITQLYKIEYFVIVMVTVNPILVYCLKKLFEDNSPESLKKISNLLKLCMIFGLIAILAGAQL